MKNKLYLLIVFLSLSNCFYCTNKHVLNEVSLQITLKDQSTGEFINNARIDLSFNKDFFQYLGDLEKGQFIMKYNFEHPMIYECKLNNVVETPSIIVDFLIKTRGNLMLPSSVSYYFNTVYFLEDFQGLDIKINAPGYYEKVTSLSMRRELGANSGEIFAYDDIYLTPVPKAQDIYVEQNTEVNSNSKNRYTAGNEILNLKEAANYLKVSESALIKLIKNKKIKAKFVEGDYIITKKSLLEFLSSD